MSDITQGQDVPDNDLFNDAVSADSSETLEKFENPELPLDLPPPKPEAKPRPQE